MVGTLADERNISLTTFKRDGTEVSTPVWVVSDDGARLDRLNRKSAPESSAAIEIVSAA